MQGRGPKLISCLLTNFMLEFRLIDDYCLYVNRWSCWYAAFQVSGCCHSRMLRAEAGDSVAAGEAIAQIETDKVHLMINTI